MSEGEQRESESGPVEVDMAFICVERERECVALDLCWLPFYGGLCLPSLCFESFMHPGFKSDRRGRHARPGGESAEGSSPYQRGLLRAGVQTGR